MAISYGTYTITEVQEGSQIWTTTVEPVSPNYTFTVSNLIGDSNAPIKTGDIIMYSYYRYTVLSVSANGTTVLAGNRVSIRGETGASAVTYSLIVSNLAIVKDKNGDISPTSITLTAKSQTGSSAIANYAGRFKIETTADNSNWTTQYTSSANESTKTWTVIDDIIAIRCSLYLKDGTVTLLDQQIIPIINDGLDGTNGTNGKDAYTVILTNENHTFAGNTTSAIASEIECNIIAYKGATQIAATIGTITGQPTGMTTALTNNGTTNAAFSVTVTTSMTSKNGVLNIPITVDGKTFTKKFTYSLALEGEKGEDGGKWYSGTTITGTSTTATIFSGSGITSAVIGDMYLNTSTYNTYRCTLGGNASTAKWVYVNNIKGNTGKGISSITNQYYLSTSNTAQAGGSWSSTIPPYVEDCYYWTKSHIVWTDNTETDTTAVLDNGLTDANANAIDARKVATNYLAVDNTGIMIADMEDGEQTPSGILTGKNVFIDSNSVEIRDGQNTLSSFGSNSVVLGQRGKSRLELSSSSICGIAEDGVKNFNIINGDPQEERTITRNGTFENTSVEEGEFDAFFNITEEFYYFHNITITATFNYTWDNQLRTSDPLTLNIDDPVEDETIVVWGISGTELYRPYYTLNTYLDCNIQHINNNMTTLYVRGRAEIVPKTTGISYEMGSIANYSITIETKTYQNASYTFGSRVVNSIHGANSFAIGEGLVASSDNQIAIGRYNNDDPEKDYAFMVGNGIYGESRSNAFAVDWNGRTEMGDIEGYGLQLSENSQSEMNDYIKCIDVNDDIIFNVSKTGVVDATGRINAPNIKLQKDSTNNADYLQCQDDNNNVNFRVLNDGSITTDGDAEIGESLVVNGSAYSIPNVTINKKSTNTTDYIKCQDANQTAKFRVLNDGGVIIGNDLVVNNNQTTNGYLNVVGNLKVDNRAPIAVKTFSWDTGTVRANGGWSKLGESVKVDGYYALGTLGFGCFSPSSGGQNVDWFVVTRCFVWSGANPTMDLTVWNQHTSATGRCVVWVKVLYAAIGAYQWLT